MVITYYGKQFFKVQLGDTVLAFNPIAKESKLKSARFGADIALISLNDPDFNGAETVAYSSKEPFVISGPGEYETKGIFIKGFLTEGSYRKEDRINTIYMVSLENMNMCFAGALQNLSALSDAVKEELDDIDVLFVPVGGNETLSPEEAHKFATTYEARIIIPMDYDTAALKSFLKEAGADTVKPVDKLTLKKKDTEGKEGEIVVLLPTN